MKIIKTFKFVSNLEYVHSILKEQNIPHSINIENLNLYFEESEEIKILKLIEDLNLDEKDVEIDSNILEGYEEWDKNMYNIGHFTGGKSPTFMNDKTNYLMYGFVILVSGIVCLVEYLNSKTFSRNGFWIFVIIILAIAGSMFYQYFKFKKEKKNSLKKK